MISGALANNIQEVIMVQGKFGDVEAGVENNLLGIKEANNTINIKTENLNQRLGFIDSELRGEIDLLKNNLEKINDNAIKSREKLSVGIGDLANELSILDEKLVNLLRDLRVLDEKLISETDKVNINKNSIVSTKDDITSIEDNLSTIEQSMKSMDKRISKLKKEISEIPVPEK